MAGCIIPPFTALCQQNRPPHRSARQRSTAAPKLQNGAGQPRATARSRRQRRARSWRAHPFARTVHTSKGRVEKTTAQRRPRSARGSNLERRSRAPPSPNGVSVEIRSARLPRYVGVRANLNPLELWSKWSQATPGYRQLRCRQRAWLRLYLPRGPGRPR